MTDLLIQRMEDRWISNEGDLAGPAPLDLDGRTGMQLKGHCGFRARVIVAERGHTRVTPALGDNLCVGCWQIAHVARQS